MLSDLLRHMHRLLETDHVIAIALLTLMSGEDVLDTKLAPIHTTAAVKAGGLRVINAACVACMTTLPNPALSHVNSCDCASPSCQSTAVLRDLSALYTGRLPTFRI